MSVEVKEAEHVFEAQGRLVVLTAERLDHILSAHPELEHPALIPTLIEAVERPYEIHYGYGANEEWRYVKGWPTRWIKVVVVYDEHDAGRMITAFGRRRKP